MVYTELHGYEFNCFTKSLIRPFSSSEKYPCKVLFGYQWNHGGGVFVDIIFRRIYGMEFDYIIDDNLVSYFGCVYKRNLFDYLDVNTTVVLNASDEDVSFLHELGYVDNKNLFDIFRLNGKRNLGYFEFLEQKFKLDVMNRSTSISVTSINPDGICYGPSRSVDFGFLLEHLVTNYPQRRVLDLGCGVGGAMIAFKDFGYITV